MTDTFLLTNEILTPVLNRLLGYSDFKIKEISIKSLKPGVGNPTSLGVYRVTAQIDLGTNDKSISLVVKHLANGMPIMDTSEKTHWNHWRREIEFFESPLVDLIPESIAFPAYFGHTTLSDGTELFWNEDLGDLEKTSWNWHDCLLAAELVAELNSINFESAMNYSWLNKTQLDGWLEMRPVYFDPIFPKVVEIGISDQELSSSFENFGRLLNKQNLLNTTLKSARQCFVHGDFNLNNLVKIVNEDKKIIALDWQLFGVAAVGSEVAAIFNTACELGVIEPSLEKFNEICEIYTLRFNSKNSADPVTQSEVRLAAAAMGFTILEGVGFYFNQPDANKSEAENNASLRAMLVDFAVGPLNIYAKVLNDLLEI